MFFLITNTEHTPTFEGRINFRPLVELRQWFQTFQISTPLSCFHEMLESRVYFRWCLLGFQLPCYLLSLILPMLFLPQLNFDCMSRQFACRQSLSLQQKARKMSYNLFLWCVNFFYISTTISHLKDHKKYSLKKKKKKKKKPFPSWKLVLKNIKIKIKISTLLLGMFGILLKTCFIFFFCCMVLQRIKFKKLA